MTTQVHQQRTQGDDEAVTIIEFGSGAIGMVESSWNRPGGMDDSIEVFGDKGQTYADLLMGNALSTYSEVGVRLCRRKGGDDQGLDLSRIRGALELRLPPGGATLRALRARQGDADRRRRDRARRAGVVYAAYASAGLGRKVMLPFHPQGIAKPIDLWKTPERAKAVR